jgi:transcriptional regulator GlxA family with amidase domain
MTRPRAAATIEVGLIVVPETAPGVLYSLLEIFSSVGAAWQNLTGQPAGPARMRARVVGEHRGLARCGLDTPVSVDASYADAIAFDVAIAPDILFDADFDPRGRWTETGSWIRAHYESGAVIASVCTGSVLLAESGILDGLEASSHWAAAPVFRRCYPRVRLNPAKVVTTAGPGHRIITAGGGASWSELALYMIERYCGREEAIRTSKVFLLGDRSDGQLPFAAMIRPRDHSDAIIGKCQAWIAEHYESSNPVARMIGASGLTPRTFARRFRAATGYTPLEYVQTLRIEEAKQLLEGSSLPVEQVAVAVGYDDPASFRRLFKRMVGLGPARYRQRFRTVGCST